MYNNDDDPDDWLPVKSLSTVQKSADTLQSIKILVKIDLDKQKVRVC